MHLPEIGAGAEQAGRIAERRRFHGKILRKLRHRVGQNPFPKRANEVILLAGDAAADQHDLRVEHMDQADDAGGDAVDPRADRRGYGRMAEMREDHLAVDVLRGHAERLQQGRVAGEPPHERAGRAVALEAAAVAARARLAVELDAEMADLAADAAPALDQPAVLDDPAADAGAHRDDEHVLHAPRAPVALLAERRRVRIVDHRDRQTERIAERPRDLAAEPVAEAGPDADHRAAAHVDLPRGRNADARGLFQTLFEQFAGERRDGREDRRPVAVKVDAARLGEKDGARFVDKAGLDGSAADVDAKQHAHEIASTNRRVMSRGRVIAVPTTAACTG